MAMEVHHGDNEDVAGFDGVDNPVRKAVRSATAKGVVEWEPSLRIRHDPPDGGANFGHEVGTQAWHFAFIEPGSFANLAGGRGQKLEGHLPMPASI